MNACFWARATLHGSIVLHYSVDIQIKSSQYENIIWDFYFRCEHILVCPLYITNCWPQKYRNLCGKGIL